MHETKQRLLDVGMGLLLKHGYADLGIQRVLSAADVPKGSFYHHFESKEDFALQIVDQYMDEVHAGLDECLGDESSPPLERVRGFFEATVEKYRDEGLMGCLLGGLGQELSGVSETFRHKLEDCLSQIADRVAGCLEEARARGELPPERDPTEMAHVLVDCWEGAALRSRMRRDPRPLESMLDFYFGSVTASGPAPSAVP
ncbi:MAG: TetR family transcriptional regulator C-terminal domain-containing protein [Gemmatimonadota bacterium]